MPAIAANSTSPVWFYCELANLYCAHRQNCSCNLACTGVVAIPSPPVDILALLIDARCAATEDACAGDAEMTANIALADHLNALDNIVQRRIAAKVAMRAGVRVVLFGNTSDAQVLVYAL